MGHALDLEGLWSRGLARGERGLPRGADVHPRGRLRRSGCRRRLVLGVFTRRWRRALAGQRRRAGRSAAAARVLPRVHLRRRHVRRRDLRHCVPRPGVVQEPAVLGRWPLPVHLHGQAGVRQDRLRPGVLVRGPLLGRAGLQWRRAQHRLEHRHHVRRPPSVQRQGRLPRRELRDLVREWRVQAAGDQVLRDAVHGRRCSHGVQMTDASAAAQSVFFSWYTSRRSGTCCPAASHHDPSRRTRTKSASSSNAFALPGVSVPVVASARTRRT